MEGGGKGRRDGGGGGRKEIMHLTKKYTLNKQASVLNNQQLQYVVVTTYLSTKPRVMKELDLDVSTDGDWCGQH